MMVPSASAKGNAPDSGGDLHNSIRPGLSLESYKSRGYGESRLQQAIDILDGGEGAAGAKGPATEGRSGICITEHHFEVSLGPPKAPRREAPSKHIPGPRAVDALHGEGGAANLAAAAPRKAPV